MADHKEEVSRIWLTVRRLLVEAGLKIAEDAEPMSFSEVSALPEWQKVEAGVQDAYREAWLAGEVPSGRGMTMEDRINAMMHH